MARLTKDAWARSSLRTQEIEVEELGGSVLIRELPASVSADLAGLVDITQVGQTQRAKVDKATMEARQFAYGVIDDDHNPLFTEEEAREVQSKHGRAFNVVIAAIDKLSGVSKEAIDEAEARFPAGRNGAAHQGEARDHDPAADSGGPDRAARAGA